MSLDRYAADALRLAHLMPEGAPAREAIEYMIGTVAAGGVRGEITDGNSVTWEEYDDTPAGFVWIGKDQLDTIEPDSHLAPYAKGTIVEAVITNSVTRRMTLILPTYCQQRPYGNALILTHALQHIEEPHATSWGDYEQGKSERDAYDFNGELLKVIDPEGFAAYQKTVPYRLHVRRGLSGATVNVTAHGAHRWAPPKDSFIEEIAREGDESKIVQRMAAIVTSLEQQAFEGGLTDEQTSTYIGHWYATRTGSNNSLQLH